MEENSWGEMVARAGIYKYLARLFHLPDEDEVREFRRDFFDNLNSFLTTLDLSPELSKRMKDFVFEGEEDVTELAKRLNIEYTYLFLNAYPELPCPPYESVYTDKDGLVMSEAAHAVRKSYGEFGLGVPEDGEGFTGELPDHIKVELEFMHFLARKEVEAFQAGDEAQMEGLASKQKDFLEEHLRVWAPQFFGNIKKNARLSFYSGVAELADAFLRQENARLQLA